MKAVLLLCIAAAIQAAILPETDEQKLTLRGRVIFADVPRAFVDSEGILTVELRDTSLMDAPAKVIAKSVGKSIRFPMAFAIKYSSQDAVGGVDYSLHVSIRNKKGNLLYTNDQHIGVTPTGLQRTKLIDVPVILIRKTAPSSVAFPIDGVSENTKGKWPELVGKNGAEAVEIIKKETGFKNVAIHRQGSPMTMDYRTDRVRVFVDDQQRVAQTPTIS